MNPPYKFSAYVTGWRFIIQQNKNCKLLSSCEATPDIIWFFIFCAICSSNNHCLAAQDLRAVVEQLFDSAPDLDGLGPRRGGRPHVWIE